MSLKQNSIDLFYRVLLNLHSGYHNRIRFRKIDGNSSSLLSDSKADHTLVLLDFFLKDADSVYIDVGANIGAFVYRALKHIKPRQVFAFEPLPDLNLSLQKKFRDIHLFNIALSNSEGSASFKIPIAGKKRLHTRATLNTDFREDVETEHKIIEVALSSLDVWSEKQSLKRVDLLKIDVEGHEENLIDGSIAFLQKFQPVLIIEIEQRHHKKSITEIIEKINAIGYKVLYFDSDSKLLKSPVDQLDDIQQKGKMKTADYINNFIFIPESKNIQNIIQGFEQFISN